MKRINFFVPAVLAAALLATGCSGGSGVTEDASGNACTAAGDASKAIKAEGELGGQVKLTDGTPAKADEMQRTVLEAGDSEPLQNGDSIKATATYFNGATGDVIQSLPEQDLTYDSSKDAMKTWDSEALRCAAPGQRVAMVVPADQALQGVSPEQAGITDMKADDPFVIVLDFVADEERAACKKTTPRDDAYPKVTTHKDEAPDIEIPECMEAPEKLEVKTLTEGDGKTVAAGDTVKVNYRGVIWATGEEFDSSWSRGEPVEFTTDGVIGGFQKALEGQKVGSTVLSVVPAEDGGYGGAQLQQMGYEADDVMVFVLDIVDTKPTEQ